MEPLRLSLSIVLPLLLLAGCSGTTTSKSAVQSDETPTLLGDFEARSLEGEALPLERWRGKVVLVVNTASECGYTPQYAGLEALHQELGPRGFEVLGFPSNDFGGQEPGDAGQIRSFCTDRFQVTFPLFEKVSVKAGSGQAPLFAWLQASTGQAPNWNF
jgi:glutathione peroxidase